MFNEYRDVMTVREAAEALGVCEAAVYRMVKEQTLGCRRIGRRILIPKLCLIQYVKAAQNNVFYL